MEREAIPMKKTLVWLLALLLTAALPASAAERFEVTDGVYVALPDVFVAYTRDSVQDKQSDFLGVDVSLLTELMDEVGYCCALLHGTHFSQCFFSVTASIFQDFADMPQERLDAEYDALRRRWSVPGYIAEPHTLTSDGGVRWLAMRLYPRAGYESRCLWRADTSRSRRGGRWSSPSCSRRKSIPAGELETYDRGRRDDHRARVGRGFADHRRRRHRAHPAGRGRHRRAERCAGAKTGRTLCRPRHICKKTHSRPFPRI